MARFLLFAIPAPFWEDRPRKTPPTVDELFREQIQEALSLRKRIQGGVNLDSERSRFTEAMGRIEGEMLQRAADSDAVRSQWDETALGDALAKGGFPALELGDNYFHLLAWVEMDRAGKRTPGISVALDPTALGTSMIPPELLGPHLDSQNAEVESMAGVPADALEAARERARFCDAVHRVGGAGIIEVQVVQDNSGAVNASFERALPPPAFVAPSGDNDELEQIADPDRRRSRRGEMVRRLDRDIALAVAQYRVDGRGGKVNASNQPHEVATDVLGEWARRDEPLARVRIVYADGSEAAPFPLCILSGRPRPTGEPRTVKAALMSMRHLAIDRVVDLAWYRNREVSQARSLAESDEFCFKYSLAELKGLFEASRELGQAIRLEIFHTGFEPASLGFYRAVAVTLTGDAAFGAEWAAGLAPWLTVVPRYYRGGTHYEASKDRQGDLIEWF